MQTLKVTDAGPGGKHIVYTNSYSGVGAMSQAKDGHTHELFYDPPRPALEEVPAYQDPMTGEEVPGTPGDPGKETGEWVVRPAVDAAGELHEHVLVEYPAKQKKTTEDPKDVIADCIALWREAISLEYDSAEKGRESERFYKGDQWDWADKNTLQSLDRAALTINEIQRNVNTLLGYQMEQRTDIRYLPQESGDQVIADMLNVISKRILDNCSYQREETKSFKDAIVAGKGELNTYVSFDRTIQGDVVVERFPWDGVKRGPHDKEDLSDCEYQVKDRMLSLAKLKMMWPDKADELEHSFDSYCGKYPDVPDIKGSSGTNEDYRNAKKVDERVTPYVVEGNAMIDMKRKNMRLVQCERKVYEDVSVIFSPNEEFFFTAYDWDLKDVALARTIPGFDAITQKKARVRITKFVGTTLLSDENPADLPSQEFYTTPIYAYRQNGEFWGVVEAVKDPQREFNKRRSQLMDGINRLGSDTVYITQNTFPNSIDEAQFKKNRSKPGNIAKVSSIADKPHHERGMDLPQGLVQIMQMDQESLQRLFNIVVERGGANESGALFLERKKDRMTGNQMLFDALAFAKQRIGRLLIPVIQRYYSPGRCIRILESQYSRSPFKLAGEDFDTYDKQELQDMLGREDLGEYDVLVTETNFAPSTRLAIAEVLFDLIGKGAPIPPELAIEFVDMPDDTRRKIAEGIQRQSEAAAQEQSTTSETEITKTLIAKGQYTVTPEKAQELGLVPATPPLPDPALQANNVPGENAPTPADIAQETISTGLAG